MKDELENILSRLGAKIEADQALVVQKAVIPSDDTLPVCAYPVDLCRVSPFFPLNRKFLGRRKYVSDAVIVKTAWGEIRYNGLILSTYEEDVLMAIITLINNNKHETLYEGRKTYVYKGHFLPIIKVLGKTSGKENYKHIFNALRVLSTAVIEIVVKKSLFISPLIFGLKLDEESKEIAVALNPYFYEAFQLKTYSLIEIDKRMRIGSPIGKALYRFIVSHRDGWRGHYIVLAKALNLDLNRPAFEIRSNIRKAIELLKAERILSKKSYLKDDIVCLLQRSQPESP